MIVPADERTDAMLALAHELLAILPVRSGHGGYAAYVWEGRGVDVPYDQIFAWCRRFFGLDIGELEGWLSGALRRLRGAAWLTILGSAFAAELDHAKRLAFSRGIDVIRSDHGAIVRAGDAPTLGDVARGEFPQLVAEVERAIAPVRIQGYDARSWVAFSGVVFDTHSEELVAMRSHHATGLYLDRYVNPAGWLGQTPRERAEQMLEKLAKRDEWREWQSEVKSGDDDFGTLLLLLYNATTGSTVADESVEALELAAQFAECDPKTLNNLLYAYNQRKELDKAIALMPRALASAEENPTVLHNMACIYALVGDYANAMHAIEQANKLGYKGMKKIEADDDLVPLREMAEWKRIFARKKARAKAKAKNPRTRR